ncbi:MAG: hypothetical protein Q4C80_06180 [Bacillota bacterium]|nr:hypothetical protein [Bacillota bacterium]
MYIIGTAAFVLFFINDYNDWKLKKKWLNASFVLGVTLLIISTVWMCVLGEGHSVLSKYPGMAVWVVCALSLFAQVYSLFFSFNCDEAYAGGGESESRYPCTVRMYALCRHPGVLFFIILYVGLALVTNMSFTGVVVLCILNILLIIFEDMLVFPAIFNGYDEYKRGTPFLLPNMNSICKCINDFRR